jgi:hypothetical protein
LLHTANPLGAAAKGPDHHPAEAPLLVLLPPTPLRNCDAVGGHDGDNDEDDAADDAEDDDSGGGGGDDDDDDEDDDDDGPDARMVAVAAVVLAKARTNTLDAGMDAGEKAVAATRPAKDWKFPSPCCSVTAAVNLQQAGTMP